MSQTAEGTTGVRAGSDEITPLTPEEWRQAMLSTTERESR